MNKLLLILLFIFTGYVLASLYEYLGKKILKNVFNSNREALVLYGYRLHHSLYGLLGLLLAFWQFSKGEVSISETLLGLSVGIIIQHTITDGFKFLTKEKN